MSERLNREAHRQLFPQETKKRRLQMLMLSLMLVWSAAYVPTEMDMSDPRGWVLNLETRLVIEGQAVSTNGDWSFLAVTGRPKHVSELLLDRVVSSGANVRPTPTLNLIGGTLDQRPLNSEPLAALVGLQASGSSASSVSASVDFWGLSNSQLLRNLSTGRSHGLMIALLAYEDSTSEDLARGRHIAGTGGVNEDGTVRTIGYIEPKVVAADRAGADIVFVPAAQAGALDGVSLANTTVVGVSTIEEAVEYLRR